MKLHETYDLACTPERFWTLYWSDAIREHLAALGGREQTMSDATEAGVRVVVTRVTSTVPLPRAVVRVTGTNELRYERTLNYDEAKRHLTWSVRSAVVPDKVKAEGEMAVEARGEGCRLRIQGVIAVHIPLIGRGIEKAVVQEIVTGYDGLVKVMTKALGQT